MKKLAAVLFCIGLCISIALLYPQVGTSNPNVDDTGCLECHTVDDLHALHDDCTACHVEVGDTPASSTCLECHGDLCDLVDAHGGAGDCLECHTDCEVIPPGDCSIDVVQDTVPRSRWLPSVALITIKGTDTGWVSGLVRENFEITYSAAQSRDLFWLPGTFPFLIEGSQTIYQLIILLPSWFTGCCFDGAVEMMTVEVCNTQTDCCDSDEVAITMLPLGLDQ